MQDIQKREERLFQEEEYQFDEMPRMRVCIKCDNNLTFQCDSSLRAGQEQDANQGWGISEYLSVNEEMAPEAEIILNLLLGVNTERNVFFLTLEKKRTSTFPCYDCISVESPQIYSLTINSNLCLWKAELHDLHQWTDV